MSSKESDLFEIVNWDAVAVWSWDIAIDLCAICRSHLMSRCIECQVNITNDNDCTVAWGECNHAFHHHCISRWLTTRQTCPLDNAKWVCTKIGK